MRRMTKYEKLQMLNADLIEAARQGKLVSVKMALDAGANIHAKNDDALCFAALNGHLEIVEYLIENGADIHSRDNAALFYASYNEHFDIIRYLIDKGANVYARTDSVLAYALNYVKNKELKNNLEHDLKNNKTEVKKMKV